MKGINVARTSIAVLCAFLFWSPSTAWAQGVDEAQAELEQINELMTEKKRPEALAGIQDLIGKLEGADSKEKEDLRNYLKRLDFYLSKYNWDMARRVMMGIMEDQGLEYEKTYEKEEREN